MIYEMRVYRTLPGRLPKLLERFRNHTLRIWERIGIRQVGFWTTMIGTAENGELTYLLVWESLAEREALWGAFVVDAEWKKAKAESEGDGPINALVTNQILAPTAFSKLQ